MLNIIRAATDDHFQEARLLFEEYAASLGVNLGFQNFDEELADLPSQYSPPNGCLLLAISEDQTAGCIPLRRLSADVCEMNTSGACEVDNYESNGDKRFRRPGSFRAKGSA